MVEIYLLEQLDAFARCGTLSAASEELHISQPALTRSMKKIEEVLGVSLFERHKNRLYLNETGKLAASLASNVISEDRMLVSQVRAFDRSLRTISLGCCAPVPSFVLTPRLQQIYAGMAVSSNIDSDEKLYKGLSDNTYQLIVTHEEPSDDTLYSTVCGHEKLNISVPPAHPLAAFDSISFADLSDVAILQYQKVGFWNDVVHEQIPNPHILYQDSYQTFSEIASASALPTFISDYFENDPDRNPGPSKIIIPISDAESFATYYLICKKSDKKRFQGIFSHLPDWCLR